MVKKSKRYVFVYESYNPISDEYVKHHVPIYAKSVSEAIKIIQELGYKDAKLERKRKAK